MTLAPQHTGTDDPQRDPLREALRGIWAAAAPAWATNAAYVDRRAADVTTALLDATAVGPGARVLELACGPGGVGIAAAERIGPRGSVVLSDVSPEMTAVAAARAESLGLGNVTTRVLDLERIDEPDGSFDVVLCREGLMLVPDPPRALREIVRVLRPGGWVGVSVWGPRGENPWLGILFDAVTEATGMPVPPPGIPGPFSLGDIDVLAGHLADAGLDGVTVSPVATPAPFASFDEWWATVPALAGPLAAVLASLPSPVVDRIRATAEGRLERYGSGAGYEVPGVALVGAARRA